MKRAGSLCTKTLAGLGLLAISALSHAQVTNTIDVLGVYPNHTASQVSDPVALFVSNIEYANRALANSQANYRYNLVGVVQQNWSNDASLGSAQLESFQANGSIRALREHYGADLVAGIVPSSNGLCGIGYLPISSDGRTIRSYSRDYAYSLSGHDCGGRTMSHEMGHNVGLGHSAAQNSSGTFGYWARGHGVQDSFVTIMAYNSAYRVYSSSGRLQMHSTPNLNSCLGQACGVVHTRSDGADAVRALNMASPQIEDYAESTTPGPGNSPPDAVNDAVETDEGQTVSLDVIRNDSDPDGDALTLASVGPPSNGTASVLSPSGTVRYVPDNGFFGADQFSYTIRDAAGATASANVSVTVNQVVGEPPGGQNLVVNGDVEAGIDGWQGVWGATVSATTRALHGTYSVRARRGYAVIGDLRTPIAGGRRFAFSAQLRSSTGQDAAYAYLRIRQNGRWFYQYITGTTLQPNTTTTLEGSVDLPAGNVDRGYIMFYFPSRIAGHVTIDRVRLEAE